MANKTLIFALTLIVFIGLAQGNPVQSQASSTDDDSEAVEFLPGLIPADLMKGEKNGALFQELARAARSLLSTLKEFLVDLIDSAPIPDEWKSIFQSMLTNINKDCPPCTNGGGNGTPSRNPDAEIPGLDKIPSEVPQGAGKEETLKIQKANQIKSALTQLRTQACRC